MTLLHKLCYVAALTVVSAFAAVESAQANHFILPCGDVCTDAHWVFTGSLNVPRYGHTATLLQDGRVLVVGGTGSGNTTLDSAELYDPVAGTWSLTGSMHLPRTLHTATLLSDGRVLVAGGLTSPGSPPNFGSTDAAEIYDPATGSWSLTGSMTTIRFWFSATRLLDGRVLVAGGAGGSSNGNLQSAELYDPGTGTWATTGSLNVARYGHTMTLLQDGRVLVARGSDDGDLASTLSSAESYDPVSGVWSVVDDSCCGSVFHTATLLPDGTALVAGGNTGGIGGDGVLAFSERFDPATRTWSRTGDLLTPRYAHTATLLTNGTVLISGGELQTNRYPNLQYVTLGSTEAFSPSTAAWSSSADLNNARAYHTATLLSDGTVLVAGGLVVTPDYKSIPLGTAELFGVPVSTETDPGGSEGAATR
ncbi:MAG TPA: kelch repeat-containing protein [Casimicrobiaceae bacterium]